MRGRWLVYILECGNGALYTGITTDVELRVHRHELGKGSKYVRQHGVRRVLYTERHPTRSAATKRELLIKSWNRELKLALVHA